VPERVARAAFFPVLQSPLETPPSAAGSPLLTALLLLEHEARTTTVMANALFWYSFERPIMGR
jgi:hypothetical protein